MGNQKSHNWKWPNSEMPGSPENPFSPAFTKRSGGKIKITALILRRGALSWVDHLWQQPQCLVIRSRGHREEGEGREDKHERTVQLIWGEITHCLSQSINTCSGHIFTFIFYKGHRYLRTVLRIQREKNSKHEFLTQEPWQQGFLVMEVKKASRGWWFWFNPQDLASLELCSCAL